MIKKIPPNLFVLEMANNHMGDLSHGIEIVRKFSEVCKDFPAFNFAFKLQYRNLDTFIHPSVRGNLNLKYIKRFEETRLNRDEFDLLIKEIRNHGFLAMATPFDENSVRLIAEQGLDILKVASCSFTDWPLLEEIAATDMPIIASTAGASLDEIDRVVSFFQHRHKEFALLHCVAEYPTADDKLNLSQIDFLKTRYGNVRIGFSTHENPNNVGLVRMAIAKGADIFEKHVGIQTQKFELNPYSASPEQVKQWLSNALFAQRVCGVAGLRAPFCSDEQKTLNSLRRGIFAKRNLKVGENINSDDVFFAFPLQGNQFSTKDWSKYASFKVTKDVPASHGIDPTNVEVEDSRLSIMRAVEKVKSLIRDSGVIIPGGVSLELSHHYGIQDFYRFGLALITIINRRYCKKLLICLPGQLHPEQYHNKKEETFHILYGDLELALDGESKMYSPGSVITIEPKIKHSFISQTGCVIEEVSSTHFGSDSFYTDPLINQNSNRKTFLTYWMD